MIRSHGIHGYTWISATRRVRQRMLQRGISCMEVERAILRGRKRRQDHNIVATYGYFEVVYAGKGDNIQVITFQLR